MAVEPWNRAPLPFDDPGVVANYDELPLWSAPFGQLILDRVPLRAGLDIVDVGCGTGFLTLELAQRCGPGSTVTAVDPWPGAIAVLRRKIRHLGLGNVVVQQSGAEHLEKATGSVDVVVSNLGVNNFDRAEEVARECRRVLRETGVMILSSNLVGHMAEFYDAFRETVIALDRHDLLPALDAHVGHRATVESLTSLLERAGFAVADVHTSAFTMRYGGGQALLDHYFVRLGFLPGWRDVVDPGSVDVVFRALRDRLDGIARERGDLTLTVPMACVQARPA